MSTSPHAITVSALKTYIACGGDLTTSELVELVKPGFPNNTLERINTQCSYARTLAGMIRDIGPRTHMIPTNRND